MEDVVDGVAPADTDLEGDCVVGGVCVCVIAAEAVDVADREREGVCVGVIRGVAAPVTVCVTEAVAV